MNTHPTLLDNWIGWLQVRIPVLKESQNVYWLKQAMEGYKSDSSKTEQGESKGYCIKRTPENADVLNMYFGQIKLTCPTFEGETHRYYGTDGFLHYPILPWTHLSNKVEYGYTQVNSAEEFFAKVGYTPEYVPAEPGNTEYVPACSQTDELYRHMFDEHDLNFSTQDLKNIIEIANRSRLKPVQVDTPIERSEHEEKVNNMRIACGIVGFKFLDKDLDMLVSIHDLVLAHGGKLDLKTITEKEFEVSERHSIIAIKD